ncbi:MAG: hypothetical protein MUQ60_06245, partial [Porticoccaceae bacterium]|nr:hypothetical protein [Porticoccaceae bacterium]
PADFKRRDYSKVLDSVKIISCYTLITFCINCRELRRIVEPSRVQAKINGELFEWKLHVWI